MALISTPQDVLRTSGGMPPDPNSTMQNIGRQLNPHPTTPGWIKAIGNFIAPNNNTLPKPTVTTNAAPNPPAHNTLSLEMLKPKQPIGLSAVLAKISQPYINNVQAEAKSYIPNEISMLKNMPLSGETSTEIAQSLPAMARALGEMPGALTNANNALVTNTAAGDLANALKYSLIYGTASGSSNPFGNGALGQVWSYINSVRNGGSSALAQSIFGTSGTGTLPSSLPAAQNTPAPTPVANTPAG